MEAPKTIFCDIDGTILNHTGDIVSNYQESLNSLKDVVQKIKQWEKNNYKNVKFNLIR